MNPWINLNSSIHVSYDQKLTLDANSLSTYKPWNLSNTMALWEWCNTHEHVWYLSLLLVSRFTQSFINKHKHYWGRNSYCDQHLMMTFIHYLVEMIRWSCEHLTHTSVSTFVNNSSYLWLLHCLLYFLLFY